MKSFPIIVLGLLTVSVILSGCGEKNQTKKEQNPFIKFNKQINELAQKLEDSDTDREDEIKAQLEQVKKAKQKEIDKMKLPHEQKIRECKEALKNLEGKENTKIKKQLTISEDEIEYINFLASEELNTRKSVDDD